MSTTFYNHYSWLRTMEDLFDVNAGDSHSPIPGGAGSVSGGLDGLGHIGYAAQPGLAPFGPDVFNNPAGPGHHRHFPGPLQAGMPLAAVVGGGSYLLVRRRQSRRLAES